MAGDFSAKVQGLDQLKAVLLGLPDKLRRRALRNALAAGARLVRNAAKAAAPVISADHPAVLRRIRARGTLQKAITVRTSKQARRDGNVGVFVNVRPARGAQRGAKKPTDPYYWRWINFGWNSRKLSDGKGKAGRRYRRKLNKSGAAKRVPGERFLEAGAAKLPDALRAFERTLGPQVRKLNFNPKDPL